MRKIKKYVLTSILSFMMLVGAVATISAATASINHSVPTRQGYKELASVGKSSSTNHGSVNLSKMEPDAVTFSAKANGNSYGSGKVVTQTKTNFTVNYTATYGKGQKMTARFRNHNWSLNSNMITGTFDYK